MVFYVSTIGEIKNEKAVFSNNLYEHSTQAGV